MTSAGGMSDAAVERRRGARVALEAPAQLNKLAAASKGAPVHLGRTMDLSMSGAFVRVKAKGPIARGEMLMVSIGIPWEYRHLFPFSRIVGSCRVTRLIEHAAQEQGVALAFNTDQMTFLGAIVAPPRA